MLNDDDRVLNLRRNLDVSNVSINEKHKVYLNGFMRLGETNWVSAVSADMADCRERWVENEEKKTASNSERVWKKKLEKR